MNTDFNKKMDVYKVSFYWADEDGAYVRYEYHNVDRISDRLPYWLPLYSKVTIKLFKKADGR